MIIIDKIVCGHGVFPRQLIRSNFRFRIHTGLIRYAMAIIITDDLLSRAQLTEDEFLVDIACYLYDKKRLSMGKARALTGLNLIDFQKELSAREIDIHYTEEDLNKDLKNLGIDLPRA